MKLRHAMLRGAALVLVFAMLTGCSGGVGATPSDQGTAQAAAQGELPHRDSDAVNAAYLEHYFDIKLSDSMTEQAFTEAVMKLQSSRGTQVIAAAPDKKLTGPAAVRYAVMGAGLDELALVYTPEQIENALKDAGRTDQAYARYVACALDMELMTAEQAKAAADGTGTDAAFARSLLMAVADYNGTGRNFQGYSEDPMTYARIMNMWAAVELSPDPLALFSDPDLLELGTKTLMDHATTGFIITDTARHARFLPELTLQYAHDDVKHIKQVLGLLQSHGIVVKVQVEPKLSMYQYLESYDYDDPTPTYEVRKVEDDFYVVYSVNCDVELEFATPEDMARFNELINDYGKKNSGEEDKALLYNAWWQPIYESFTEMDTSRGDYFLIYDHLISNGRYLLRVSTKDDILDLLKASAPDAEIQQIPLWINAAYYRYLLGEAE